MSYSVDLWNSYNKLEQILESHLKGLKTFIYIFSEYYSCQQTFSKELKRLSDYLKNNSITTFESLNEGIISFQNERDTAQRDREIGKGKQFPAGFIA